MTPQHPPASPQCQCRSKQGWQDKVPRVFALVTGLSPGALQLFISSPAPGDGAEHHQQPGDVRAPQREGFWRRGWGSCYPESQPWRLWGQLRGKGELKQDQRDAWGGWWEGSRASSACSHPAPHRPRPRGRSLLTSRGARDSEPGRDGICPSLCQELAPAPQPALGCISPPARSRAGVSGVHSSLTQTPPRPTRPESLNRLPGPAGR